MGLLLLMILHESRIFWIPFAHVLRVPVQFCLLLEGGNDATGRTAVSWHSRFARHRELATLTATLAQALSRFTISLNAWDLQPDKKWFHATIVNRLLTDKSSKIMEGLAATQTDIPSVALSGSVLSLLHAYLAALTGGSAISVHIGILWCDRSCSMMRDSGSP